MNRTKLFLTFISILFPFFAYSISIETNEIDEFTGNRTIITSWESICNNDIQIRFRLQERKQFLDMRLIYDNNLVLLKKSKILLKSTADEICEYPDTYNEYGFIGGGGVDISASFTGNLTYLTTNTPRLMRIVAGDYFIDKKINKTESETLLTLYNSLLTEIKKYFTDTVIQIIFFRSLDNGTTWEHVSTKKYKNLTEKQLYEIIQKWRSKSTEEIILDCKIKTSIKPK